MRGAVADIDLRRLNDDFFVVRFGGKASEIDVYTLSEALTGIADALREINALVNPGVELEVIVEATSSGSFRAKLKTKKEIATVFGRVAEAIVLGLLVNYLYDQLTYHKPTYKVVGDQLIVETWKEKIIFPKSVFDHKDVVSQSPTVAKAVKKTLEAVQQDQAVTSLGVLPTAKKSKPAIDIPRDQFDDVIARLDRALRAPTPELMLDAGHNTPTKRTVAERTPLVIVKAVLRRSRRKWEFNWHGIDLSAPIVDATFFDRLQTRQIAISQGDSLDVELSITQEFDADARVWRNIHYEVTKVFDLLEGPRQATLPW